MFDLRLPLLPLLLCLVASACSDAAAEERTRLTLLPGAAPESFDRPNYHDFGSVPNLENVEHVFRLRNDSLRAVNIQRVRPSCGCTVPALRAVWTDGTVVAGKNWRSKDPVLLEVPPGAVCEVNIRIETEHVRPKNTLQLLTTAVTSDADENAFVHFEVNIQVERPFDVLPPVLDFGTIPHRVGGSTSVDVVPGIDFPHRVTGVLEVTEGWTVELEERNQQGRWITKVSAELGPRDELGFATGKVSLSTVDGSGNPSAPVHIGMRMEAVLDVTCIPARIIMVADRDSAEAVSAEGRISSLIPGQKLRLARPTLSAGAEDTLGIELVPLNPDEEGFAFSWTVRVSTRPPLSEERLEVTLRVDLDEHPMRQLEIPVLVHLR